MFQVPFAQFYDMPIGFRFGQTYPPGFGPLTGQPHLGVDQGNRSFHGAELLAMDDGGRVSKMIPNATEGGNTLWYIDSKGQLWRFLHLKKFANIGLGMIKRGTVMGFMGNTGLVNPKPTPQDPKAGTHCHYDISKSGQLQLNNFNNFIDPLAEIDLRLKGNSMTPQEALEVVRSKYQAKFKRIDDPMLVLAFAADGKTEHYLVKASGARLKIVAAKFNTGDKNTDFALKSYNSAFMERNAVRVEMAITDALLDGGDYLANLAPKP